VPQPSYTEKAQLEPVGPKFLRITDIQDGEVDWDAVPYCKVDDEALRKYSVENRDIVFARTGATTGKSYLLSAPPEAVCASYLIRLRMKKSRLKPEFLSYFFQTDTYWDEVRRGISGSTQGGFNASKLGNMIVPAPPLEEQSGLVEKMTEIEKSARSAELKFRAKLADIADLRQSLLQKAFSGQLT
jgi:type I restriction enzyme S subunit